MRLADTRSLVAGMAIILEMTACYLPVTFRVRALQ